jgi:hypothetical protein
MTIFVAVEVALAEVEWRYAPTYLGKVFGPLNKILFWPIFALDILPGSRLDTPWFFLPMMLPMIVFWSWLFLWSYLKIRKR